MVLRTFIWGFLRDLGRQRLRAGLTIFGITWGTVGVVVLLAFTRGLKLDVVEEQRALGDGIVIAWPQTTTKQFKGQGRGRQLRLDAQELLALPDRIPELEAISPEFHWRVRLSRGSKVRSVRLAGIYPAFQDLRNLYPQPGGRFINQADLDSRRRVIFLGNERKKQLFGSVDPVGQSVVVNRIPLTVIGWLRPKEQSSSYGGGDGYQVFIPATTFQAMFGQRFPDLFVYRPKSPAVHAEATRKVYEALGRRYQFDPTDRAALFLWDTTQSMRFFYYLFLCVDLLMGVGGSFTLMVGGIGVANIMYIAVRERTQEIGITMAVGAKPRHILALFMAQALLLTLIGGALGFAVAWGITSVLCISPATDYIGFPRISTSVAAISVTLLGIIGLMAGYFPARRAAAMDPVRALGY